MLTKGTSARFWWSLPLLGSLLLNQLSVTAGRRDWPPDLRSIFLPCAVALLVPGCWAIVKRKEIASVDYTPLDYYLYAVIFAAVIALLALNRL